MKHVISCFIIYETFPLSNYSKAVKVFRLEEQNYEFGILLKCTFPYNGLSMEYGMSILYWST